MRMGHSKAFFKGFSPNWSLWWRDKPHTSLLIVSCGCSFGVIITYCVAAYIDSTLLTFSYTCGSVCFISRSPVYQWRVVSSTSHVEPAWAQEILTAVGVCCIMRKWNYYILYMLVVALLVWKKDIIRSRQSARCWVGHNEVIYYCFD